MSTKNQKLILLVDDDEDICLLIINELRDSGYQVVCVSDLKTALSELNNRKFVCAIVDIILDKNTTSDQIFLKIQKDETCLNYQTPIIVTSSHLSEAYQASIRKKCPAIQGGVKKPFHKGDFIAEINRIIPAEEEKTSEEASEQDNDIQEVTSAESLLSDLKGFLTSFDQTDDSEEKTDLYSVESTNLEDDIANDETGENDPLQDLIKTLGGIFDEIEESDAEVDSNDGKETNVSKTSKESRDKDPAKDFSDRKKTGPLNVEDIINDIHETFTIHEEKETASGRSYKKVDISDNRKDESFNIAGTEDKGDKNTLVKGTAEEIDDENFLIRGSRDENSDQIKKVKGTAEEIGDENILMKGEGEGNVSDGHIRMKGDGEGNVSDGHIRMKGDGEGNVSDGHIRMKGDGEGNVNDGHIRMKGEGEGNINDGHIRMKGEGEGNINDGHIRMKGEGEGNINDENILIKGDGQYNQKDENILMEGDGEFNIDNENILMEGQGEGNIKDENILIKGDGQYNQKDENILMEGHGEGNIREENIWIKGNGERNIKDDVHIIEGEGNEIKDDVHVIEGDGKEIKDDIHVIKGDGKEIKDDIHVIKNDGKEIKDDVHFIKGDGKEIKDDIHVIQSDNKIIKDDKYVIESDNKIIKDDKYVIESDNKIIKDDKFIIKGDEKKSDFVINDKRSAEAEEKKEFIINDKRSAEAEEKKEFIINDKRSAEAEEKKEFVINDKRTASSEKKKDFVINDKRTSAPEKKKEFVINDKRTEAKASPPPKATGPQRPESPMEDLEKEKVNSRNKLGETPCMIAAQIGDLDNIKKMVELGADLNLISKKGKNVLHYAARTNNIELIDYLIDEHNLKVVTRDAENNDALFDAVMSGSCKSATHLINKGARLTSKVQGKTYLMIAAQRGDMDMIKSLLVAGLNPDIKDPNGRTVLHYLKKSQRKQFAVILKAFIAHKQKKAA